MNEHWAKSLVGIPWTPEHNCWWLVRHVFETHYGVTMPNIQVGELRDVDNLAAIQEAAKATGFRPFPETPPQPGDIVLMRGPLGERHVGVMIETNKGPRMLHSEGHMSLRGPIGSVVAQPLRDLVREGYTNFEPWRRG